MMNDQNTLKMNFPFSSHFSRDEKRLKMTQVPITVAAWNRRQGIQHQYTPAVPHDDVEYRYPQGSNTSPKIGKSVPAIVAARRGGPGGAGGIDNFDSSMIISPGPHDPHHYSASPGIGSARKRSARDLNWEKRTHATPVANYTPKVTSLPDPALVRSQQHRKDALTRSGARRFASQREFNREKMAHKNLLFNAGYTLDFDDGE